MTDFILPPKTLPFLQRLYKEYAEDESQILAKILESCRVFVAEGVYCDNWNGGTYGHGVKLFLPDKAIGIVKVRDQQALCDKLCDDLNICANAYDDERYHVVTIEPDYENDPEARRALPLVGRYEVPPESLSIWNPGHVRLFISHRDVQKSAAKALADRLADYGISSFVAHDTIEPMTTWRSEILKGLETMEVMLAFLTDGFHDSIWTNQEIGFALGRRVPVIPLKTSSSDPAGFVGDIQAVKGCIDDMESTAKAIYRVISDLIGNRERIQTAIISAFLQSQNFEDTKFKFNRLSDVVTSLSDGDLDKIVAGFRDNTSLNKSYYLTNQNMRLANFLNRTTGKRFRIQDENIERLSEGDDSDDIPF